MNKLLIHRLYEEYNNKIDSIIEEYGEKDGFVIEGELWWDYYKELIDGVLDKIKNNRFTEDDAIKFYKTFGFGPKLYGISFIENGIQKIENLFLFLIDDDISADEKIRTVAVDPENERFMRGVGINFVTLFLTTYFPEKYVQWNIQTDGALKILGMYPKKDRGEKKSEFYLKINETCKKIGKMFNITSLPKIDNFLYCLNRGYIGTEIQIETEYEKETKEKEEIEKKELKIEISKHTEMMYYLIKIGLNKNYDVWIAINDKNKEYKGEKFSEICLKEIPKFTQPTTLTIAKYIDVIWFKKNTAQPVRFFEIEHTSSIYSGLLRLNDVKIDYPISKATIIIPNNRINLFETQIDRRTFKYTELSDVCDSLTYENLKEWYEAADTDSKYS